MATVTVPTPAVSTARRGFYLRSSTGKSVHLPLAPTTGERGGAARKWATMTRPARTDVLVETGPGLKTASYPLVVTYGDGRSIATVLAQLEALAGQVNDGVAISGLGVLESDAGTLWRITDLTVAITHRREDNDPRRAEITLQLTAVSDVRTKVGKSAKPKKKRTG